jgi:hypothetical protein
MLQHFVWVMLRECESIFVFDINYKQVNYVKILLKSFDVFPNGYIHYMQFIFDFFILVCISAYLVPKDFNTTLTHLIYL